MTLWLWLALAVGVLVVVILWLVFAIGRSLDDREEWYD